MFGPSHLIVAILVLILIGPRKLTRAVRRTAESVQRLLDRDDEPTNSPTDEAALPQGPIVLLPRKAAPPWATRNRSEPPTAQASCFGE